MTHVGAIYRDGVFKPLQNVGLPENQRVRLSVQPVDTGDVRAWLAEVHELQQPIISRRGHFPDSTADIAAPGTYRTTHRPAVTDGPTPLRGKARKRASPFRPPCHTSWLIKLGP